MSNDNKKVEQLKKQVVEVSTDYTVPKNIINYILKIINPEIIKNDYHSENTPCHYDTHSDNGHHDSHSDTHPDCAKRNLLGEDENN